MMIKSKNKDFVRSKNNSSLFRKQDEFLLDNRHILYHMIDIRQNHIEEFNMFLLLLIVSKF